MKLLIVESPAKAKTISKYLDGAYEVKASVGHIRDLPKSNKKAIDIPAGFVPHYEISKGKEHVVAEIQALAKHADEIILATDPDREGEAIAWHLAQIIENDLAKLKVKSRKLKGKIQRVTYHEITKEAIEEALKHPREIDMNLKEAQEARRVLDRLFGYDLSGLIWKKVRYGLSAGRVQSPALRIIVEREREINAFNPEDYWAISGEFNTNPKSGDRAGKKVNITLACEEEPRDKKEVDRILAEAEKNKWNVIDIKETKVKRSPKPPFTTSTLQQAASSRLGYTPSRTMGLAQKLYEAGHITYMRTDSVTLSVKSVEHISEYIVKNYGKENLTARTFATKSKNAQEAHEAVRPTHIEKESAGANDDEKKLYKLIWQRALASQMTDADILRTKIVANIHGATIPDFSVGGSRTLFPGWLIADPQAKGDDVELPKVNVGDELDLLSINAEAKQTQPPARYSEAGLVKELEKRGIGRPSTYASTIKTILDREYVEKIGSALKPTDTGEVVSTYVEKNFEKYISDEFTAEMEDELDEIALGKLSYIKVLKDFYGPFLKDIKEQEKSDKVTTLGDADPKLKCPKCGKHMIIKLGRGGKFLSCSTYPECDGALMMDGTEIKKDEPIGQHPETGENIFVKVGKYGPYVQLGEQVKSDKKSKSKATMISVVLGTPGIQVPTEEPEEIEIDSKIKKKGKKAPKVKLPKPTKPRMASIPRGKDLSSVTVEDAVLYLSIPRTLGNHPETGKTITANNGRFGPYVAHDGNFRSIKTPDDVYTIELPRALELLAQEKKKRGFQKKSK
jgi:DNA topoisomerase I